MSTSTGDARGGSGASGMSALRPLPSAGRFSMRSSLDTRTRDARRLCVPCGLASRSAAAALRALRARARGTPRRRAISRRTECTGMPWLGASPRRTLRGMTVLEHLLLEELAARRAATCWPRFVRSSYIVSSTPSMSSAGLSDARTRRSVPTRSASPSSAKYSQCSGISTASAATSAFSVSRPSDGGQSMKM